MKVVIEIVEVCLKGIRGRIYVPYNYKRENTFREKRIMLIFIRFNALFRKLGIENNKTGMQDGLPLTYSIIIQN